MTPSHVICHCCASTGWCLSTHIQPRATFSTRAIFILKVEKHVAAILAWRQPTELRLLAAHWGQGVKCSLPKHYHPHSNVRREWMAMSRDISKVTRVSDAVLRVSSLVMAVILNKLKQWTLFLMSKSIIMFAWGD